MSVEQIARDIIVNMGDEAKVKSMLAPGAMASGGVLPEPMPATEAFGMISGLKTGFPDLKFDAREVKVNGNQATVITQVSGTNTGPLSLPIPGMPSIPPTGKKVSFPDAYLVTVQGDKVSALRVDSPANGGIPAMLAQLGVRMPGM